MNSKQLGFFGEKIALTFLKNKGYKILDKNYSFRISGSPQKGEIDIVAKRDNIITFVEIKTLLDNQREQFSLIMGPEEKVDYLKQKKIIKTAESWLTKKKIPLDKKWQIDIVSIKINPEIKKAKIQHFQNAVF